MITILTTTYNRANLLPNLYHSLIRQTNKNFIWLIIDDGSNDNTKKLISEWQGQNLINIEYHHHSNKGKILSHNFGVSICKTESIICVDSDDYLVDNAVADLIIEWTKIRDYRHIGGIVCYRQMLNSKNEQLRHHKFSKLGDVNLSNLLYETKIETGLLFRTDIIKNYPFTPVDDEIFIPEEISYDQMSDNYLFRTLPKDLIVCKYYSDGYTQNYDKLIFQNPKSFSLIFNERIRRHTSFSLRFLMSIVRFVSCNIIKGNTITQTIRECNNKTLCFLLIPFGMVYYRKILMKL